MDSNIDPSIAEEEFLSVSIERSKNVGDIREGDTELHHGGLRDGGGAIRNVFRLNEYVRGGGEEDTEHQRHASETASAALNMLQFGNLEGETDMAHGGGDNIEGFMTSNGPFAGYGEAAIMDSEYLVGPSPATVKLVQYNPAEKAKRLGRPRKHIPQNLTPPENSSSQNYNGSILSKFRLDTRPLEGPGSRGGRQMGRKAPRGRITSGSVNKRKQQSKLNFSVSKLQSSEDTEARQAKVELRDEDTGEGQRPLAKNLGFSKKMADTEQKEASDDGREASMSKIGTDSGLVEDESIAVGNKTTKGKGEKRNMSSSQSKRNKYLNLSSVSRTTVINNKGKLSRQLPGPLIELYYDLYDDNIINSHENDDYKPEKVALGFRILQSNHADSIIVILSFLTKFKSVIRFQNIGPQDIEEGLGLHPSKQNPTDLYCCRTPDFPVQAHEKGNISPLMNQLTSRLLRLALNKKKDVSINSKTINELKSLASLYGLPKEWRDDSKVLTPNVDESIESCAVDLHNPAILIVENVYYDPPEMKDNPLISKAFELEGLSGIEDPVDRLILLRSLSEWCLKASDEIRELINSVIQNQNHYLEKETYYGPRSVLRGFKATRNSKRDIERKLKKKSNDSTKYCDPTSDPLDHSLRLRLNEFIVGDCGFHIGRFYLCRMADEHSGGISSIANMETANSSNSTTHSSSRFKLYVQDVHSMLTESLNNFGVEFNEEGEIHPQVVKSNYWYEVASNYQEICDFIDYLQRRLGISPPYGSESVIGSTSMVYKPIMNLYNYLVFVSTSLAKGNDISTTKDRDSKNYLVNYNESLAQEILSSSSDGERDEVDGMLVDSTNLDDDDDEYKQDDDDDEYMD